MERGERRGSLGRAFMKLKEVMKRRKSSDRVTTATPLATTPKSLETAVLPPSGTEIMPAGALDSHEVGEDCADTPAAHPSTTTADVPLIAASDDDEEAADANEPSVPMLSTRTGISEDKARTLFEKYGLKYESRKTSSEHPPPTKIRRVEKAVRIRIHWTCHECDASFSVNKTCTHCGHRRCQDCPRSPARRVREILESAREVRQQEEQQPAAPSSEQQEPPEVAATVEALDESTIAILPDIGSSARLERDNTTSGDDVDITEFQYTIQHRPRSGMDMVLRPKAQIIRRTCHECNTKFRPASQKDCRNCGHLRCKLCPRDPAKPEKWPRGSPGDEEPRMVATVQRVYKKARQRVRWSCHECQTMFVDRDHCRHCGHEKCKACPRTP